MKLQDFLIGMGLFALFTVIIFGAISTSDSRGLYSENWLNITHDTETENIISNVSSVGSTTSDDFDSITGDLDDFSSNRSTDEETSDASLVKESIGVLIGLPKAYKPASNAMRMIGTQFGIPREFTTWIISSIIIIIILILLASFLQQKLQS